MLSEELPPLLLFSDQVSLFTLFISLWVSHQCLGKVSLEGVTIQRERERKTAKQGAPGDSILASVGTRCEAARRRGGQEMPQVGGRVPSFLGCDYHGKWAPCQGSCAGLPCQVVPAAREALLIAASRDGSPLGQWPQCQPGGSSLGLTTGCIPGQLDPCICGLGAGVSLLL